MLIVVLIPSRPCRSRMNYLIFIAAAAISPVTASGSNENEAQNSWLTRMLRAFSSNPSTDCCICLENIDPPRFQLCDIKRFDCRHGNREFHVECIENCISTTGRNFCPLCRAPRRRNTLTNWLIGLRNRPIETPGAGEHNGDNHRGPLAPESTIYITFEENL